MKDGLYFDIEPEFPGRFPLLTLRDIVVFPFHIVQLFVGRQKSVRAVEHAIQTDKLVFLTAQKEINIESPAPEDLYSVGTVGLILRMLRVKESPDKMKILIQGICKARILEILQTAPFYTAALDKRDAEKSESEGLGAAQLISAVKGKLDKVIFEYSKVFPAEILMVIENLEDPEKLAHLVAANIGLEVSQAQEILETGDPIQKLKKLCNILEEQIESIRKEEGRN